MYKPAPCRPKKTAIVRSRSGCSACRTRRVKCDEKKPGCGLCVRLGKVCRPATLTLKFRMVFPEARPLSSTESDSESRTMQSLASAGESDTIPQSVESPQETSLFFERALVMSERTMVDEAYYYHHWKGHCVHALGELFRSFEILSARRESFKSALLALSACNLSRLSPEKSLRVSKSGSMILGPRNDHLRRSQEYYGSAILKIVATVQQDSESQPCLMLCTLILLCYHESAMGNFSAFKVHSEAILRLVNVNLQKLVRDPLGQNLIAAWLLSRYHNWWLRTYFSTFSYQRSQQCLSPSPQICLLLRTTGAHRTIVNAILCESHRLNVIAMLCLWSEQDREHIRPMSFDRLIVLLNSESRKLDDWHLNLSPHEMPAQKLCYAGSRKLSGPILQALSTDGPLLFHTLESAVNYAYYATARIMQCTSILDDLRKSSNRNGPIRPGLTEDTSLLDKDDETIMYWMSILVRIVAGLVKTELLCRNIYSIGVTNLLLICMMRCRDALTGRWIHDWIKEWTLHSPAEEGSFPVMQALVVVDLINRLRASRKDTLAVGLPHDDGGGEGKYFSYDSQKLHTIVLRGQCRDTGRLFSDTISLETCRMYNTT
ncbi:hypothetical protein M436DRAFT_59280 [Aureobasidium namibiae CBS 147.97]|uniref:Zn(2)-C6 fungal-type domain-containing protein n=1 Tax=Aureobasidium namibiae CBS 147.97 TaxID=1043004 RepID=A0A074W5A8_9PEZI|nr:uncharacterized protein M436DRAFT_59280 [Aureobasidium namibiae CBS 147.97]KEQ68043.1 hypothetical protein M436DRAFT_59280 [Aureobasidium namibiae CBS 147.97]